MKKYLFIFLFSFFVFIPKSYALEQNYSIDVFSFTYEESSGLNCEIVSRSTTLTSDFTQYINFYDGDSSYCSAPSLGKTLGINVTTDITSGSYYTITQTLLFEGSIQFFQENINQYTQCGVFTSSGWNMSACSDVVVTATPAENGSANITYTFKPKVNGTKYTFTVGSLNNNYSMFYTVGGGGRFRMTSLKVDKSDDPVLGAIGSLGQQNNTIINQNKETNEKLDDIEGALTDSTPPSEDELNVLNGASGWLPPGPIDSILTLPLTMMESLSNNLGKECAPLDFTLPYINKQIYMPCFNSFIYNTGFNDLWDWFGRITGAFLLYAYLLSLYKWVDNTLQFRENNHIDNWGGV